jgi:hypothetical protein
MNSIRMQCLAWSMGRGTGNWCSCRTCQGGGNTRGVCTLSSEKLRNRGGTFKNAHSFCAARRDMYIQEADLRLPK